MQNVSTDYRKSMQGLARNKSHIRVYLGIVNQTAQHGAVIDGGGFTAFSDTTAPLGDANVEKLYATFEEKWNSLDGSMYFLPRDGAYFQAAAVTEALASSQPEVTVRFNTEDNVTLKGVTIKFGKSWPTELTIITDNGRTKFKNDSQEFVTEEVFEGITFMTIKATRMSRGETRLRIEKITCGIGVTFDDNKIISTKMKGTVSPISEDMPTLDITVTVENMDGYYNVDNDDSAINYIATGQEMTVHWGYTLDDGSVEWFKGDTLYMKEWKSTSTTAKFEATDIYEVMDGEFNKGLYRQKGINLYGLATEVFEDAGFEAGDYWLDPHLEKITVYNPLPVAPHKECLQMIANAGRCILTQTPDGMPMIKSSFTPKIWTSANAESGYSNAAGLLNGTDYREYASYEPGFARVDGTQYFMPADTTKCFKAGFVSAEAADSGGCFTTNPVITITMEAAYSFHDLTLYFGTAVPAEFIIRVHSGEDITQHNYKCTTSITAISMYFEDTDSIEIEFTKAQPYDRIHLMRLKLGDVTDYTISYNDLFEMPTGTKLEKVKEVKATRTIYTRGTTLSDLVQEDITATDEAVEYEFSFSNAVHDLTAVCMADDEEIDMKAEIVEQKSYWCRVRVSDPPDGVETVSLVIRGYEYTTSTSSKTARLNNTGKTQEWENPLISSEEHAQELADWVGEYYASENKYELKFRGDPALKPNDIVFLESDYDDGLMARIESIETDYTGSISGKITARRKE
jgi:hypothetical protein